MNLLFKTLSWAVLLLTTGCLAPGEYSPVNTFDLGTVDNTNIKLNIGSIDQNGPYNSRMMYRVTPQQLEIQEFERWTQSPDLILNNYLKKAFLPGGDLILDGEIIAFENDLIDNKAIFNFHYRISKGGINVKEGVFSGKTDSTSNSEDYAAAMSKLAKDLVKAITEKIK